MRAGPDAGIGRVVAEVLPQLKTGRFDRPLTYAVPAGMTVDVGDVVRVPLGAQQLYGYVVSPPHAQTVPVEGLRAIVERVDAPRAFTPLGLELARWMADRYVCTLGEALGAIVFGGSLPRVVDRFTVAVEQPAPERYSSVPARLLRLIWEDLRDGFGREALLRHPEARRAGDRAALLRHLTALVRSGDIVRSRTFEGARIARARVTVLRSTGVPVRGPKARLLVDYVEREGEVRRADALHAGFSSAVIARAVQVGALTVEWRDASSPSHEGAIALPAVTPTSEQSRAIDAVIALLERKQFAEVLVHGVTGSGKTYVYIAAIAKVVREGGRAIVLVPEIALTPQTARRFEAAFGARVAVLHSALSERERFEAWQAAARGAVSVVVGARSAVFAPLPEVRLIVVDEMHETSYKQDSAPRYNAVTVARERMRREGGVLVTGSATPSIDVYARAAAGRIPLVELHARATAQAPPRMHVVDMAAEFAAGNKRIFSSLLVDAIDVRLQRGEKTVLFINRRGSAGFLLCRACGYVPPCTRCTTSMSAHRGEGLLRCHYCDLQRPIPAVCPHCGSGPIRDFGIGTERVAEEVAKLFPQARIVRMDSDTTTRIGDHARLLDRFEAEGDVLVGTQMVAKGLDYPSVTLVGVVAADIGLHIAEYRASERTFALVTQVSGRSGRARPGEAVVQTYSPEHPAIAFALRGDYRGFVDVELAQRRALGYPPFGTLVYLGVIGRSRKRVEAASAQYAALLREGGVPTVLGPAPYPIARVNEEWRYRIAIRTRDPAGVRTLIREVLLPLAHADRETRLVVNVDP